MAGTIVGRFLRSHLQVHRLNGVRPRWPEQSCHELLLRRHPGSVSMESGLDGRNNMNDKNVNNVNNNVSMESGLDGRNNELEILTGPYWK